MNQSSTGPPDLGSHTPFPSTPFISIYGFLVVVGVTGNLFVIVLILICLHLKNISNVYIFNLAIADLLYILGLPLLIANMYYENWLWGTVVCKLFYFATGVNRYGSSIFLTILCVDRFLAVCFPIASRSFRTLRNAVITAFASWAVVGLLMAPVIMSVTVIPIGPDAWACSFNYNPNPNETDSAVMTIHSFTIYSVIIGLSFLATMWGLYSTILWSLWCRTHIMSSSRQRSTRRVTFTVLAILIFYTVCWVPLWTHTILISFFMDYISMDWASHKILFHVGFVMNYANSAFNPLLYTLLSESYRNVIFDKLRVKPKLVKPIPKRHCLQRDKALEEELPLRDIKERELNTID